MRQFTIFRNVFKNCSLFFVLCSLLLTSCDRNRVYEKNIDIPDYVWDVNNKPSFEVNIDDTVSLHNLYVNVRQATHYQYANLYIFATITFPNGKTRKDTIECMLADEKGQWKGDGLGDIWDNQILWKPNIKFPLKGKYTFEYEQAMRTGKLPFIMDVGLRIERAKMKRK